MNSLNFLVALVKTPSLPDSLSPSIQVFKFPKKVPSSVPKSIFLKPLDSPAIDTASPARAALTGPMKPRGVAAASIPEIPAIAPPVTSAPFVILIILARASLAFSLFPKSLSNKLDL